MKRKINQFCKGFYSSKTEIKKILYEVKSQKLNSTLMNVDYNAEIFLHGFCHIFAYALHKKYGYKIFEFKNPSGTMIHWCCIKKYKGYKLFIDVRGITSNYNEFLDEFQPDMGECPTIKNIVNLSKYNDEWEEKWVDFANEIIEKYPEYYFLN